MTSSDPYTIGDYTWQAQLREAGDAYFEADDALKVANEELKPFRKKKKEAKEALSKLMRAHKVEKYLNQERGEALFGSVREAQRRPRITQIQKRCIAFCKDEDKGERLYEFLMAPDADDEPPEPAFSLRRKKVALGDADREPSTGGIASLRTDVGF